MSAKRAREPTKKRSETDTADEGGIVVPLSAVDDLLEELLEARLRINDAIELLEKLMRRSARQREWASRRRQS